MTDSAPTTMTSCNGDEITLVEQPLEDARDYIYCELVFNYDGDCGGDIYSTSPLAPCDVTWWDNLDIDALAAEFGAESITKNGPQYWSMDTVSVKGSDERFDMSGADMIFGANLAPGTVGASFYTVFYPTKTQAISRVEGRQTNLPPHRRRRIRVPRAGVQAGKDNLDDPDFQDLPEGWSYSVVAPEEDLVFDLTPDAPIPSVQDEFDQIYIRIPDETPPSAAFSSSHHRFNPVALALIALTVYLK